MRLPSSAPLKRPRPSPSPEGGGAPVRAAAPHSAPSHTLGNAQQAPRAPKTSRLSDMSAKAVSGTAPGPAASRLTSAAPTTPVGSRLPGVANGAGGSMQKGQPARARAPTTPKSRRDSDSDEPFALPAPRSPGRGVDGDGWDYSSALAASRVASARRTKLTPPGSMPLPASPDATPVQRTKASVLEVRLVVRARFGARLITTLCLADCLRLIAMVAGATPDCGACINLS